MPAMNTHPATILLLGSGELGKELVICAQRYGCRVIAADHYAGAPAMQVADHAEVIDMLDGRAIKTLVRRYQPDYVVPEVEAIRTEGDLLRNRGSRGPCHDLLQSRGTQSKLW